MSNILATSFFPDLKTRHNIEFRDAYIARFAPMVLGAPSLALLSGSTGLPLLPPGSHNIVHQLVMRRWHSVSEDFMRKRIAIRQDASICYLRDITSSNTTSFKWTHFKEAQNPGIKVASADAAINISLIVIIFIVVKLGEGARGGSSVQCNSPSVHCQLSRLPVIVLTATCRYTTLLLSFCIVGFIPSTIWKATHC